MKKTVVLFIPLLFSFGCSKGLATIPPTPSFVSISPQTAAVTCDADACVPQTIVFTATVKDQNGNLMPNAPVGIAISLNVGFTAHAAITQGPGQTATMTFQPGQPPGGTVYATAIITTFGGTLVKSQATVAVTQQ